MPHDTGAITLLMLAAALTVGVLGISERVQSQPAFYTSAHASSHASPHRSMQPLHYADWHESQE